MAKSVKFNKSSIDFIEHHAKINKNREIYGWLLGYETKREIYIHAAYSCHSYSQQTMIGAEPDPRELNSLNISLPFGIYNLGVYHSHPQGIFHSHTDSKTLLEMEKMYPNVISVITNGVETKGFQVVKNKVREFNLNFQKINLSFHQISYQFEIRYDDKINKAQLASKTENQLTKKIRNFDLKEYQDQFLDLEVIDLGGTSRIKMKKLSQYFLSNSQPTNEQLSSKLGRFVYEILYLSKSPSKIVLNQIEYFGIPFIISDQFFSKITFLERAKVLGNVHKLESDQISTQLT